MEKGQGKGTDTLPIMDGFAHKEYIEREAAKMAVVEALGKGHSPFNAIVMLPAADVVEVVRCGECKFRVYGGCSLHDIWRGENFFCADGEKRNGDSE